MGDCRVESNQGPIFQDLVYPDTPTTSPCYQTGGDVIVGPRNTFEEGASTSRPGEGRRERSLSRPRNPIGDYRGFRRVAQRYPEIPREKIAGERAIVAINRTGLIAMIVGTSSWRLRIS